MREFDGEQAYEKMMQTPWRRPDKEKASGEGQGCGEGKAGVG